MSRTVEDAPRELDGTNDPRYRVVFDLLFSEAPIPDCDLVLKNYDEFCSECSGKKIRKNAAALLSEKGSSALPIILYVIYVNLDLVTRLGPQRFFKLWSLSKLRLKRPNLKISEFREREKDSEYNAEHAKVYRLGEALHFRCVKVALWLLESARSEIKAAYTFRQKEIIEALVRASVSSHLTKKTLTGIAKARKQLQLILEGEGDPSIRPVNAVVGTQVLAQSVPPDGQGTLRDFLLKTLPKLEREGEDSHKRRIESGIERMKTRIRRNAMDCLPANKGSKAKKGVSASSNQYHVADLKKLWDRYENKK